MHPLFPRRPSSFACVDSTMWQSCRSRPSSEGSAAAPAGQGIRSSLGCRHRHPLGCTLLPRRTPHWHPLRAGALASWRWGQPQRASSKWDQLRDSQSRNLNRELKFERSNFRTRSGPAAWHSLGSAPWRSTHKGAFIHNRNNSERNLSCEWRREGAVLALAGEEFEPRCSRQRPGAEEQLSGPALSTHAAPDTVPSADLQRPQASQLWWLGRAP